MLGQDEKNLAIAFVAFGVLAFASQVFALEPLRKRFSLVNVLVGALIARGILFMLMPALPNIFAFSILLGFFGLVNAFPMPLIDSVLSTRSSERQQGEALGLNASYLSISNAIGPAVLRVTGHCIWLFHALLGGRRADDCGRSVCHYAQNASIRA